MIIVHSNMLIKNYSMFLNGFKLSCSGQQNRTKCKDVSTQLQLNNLHHQQ